MTDSLFSSLTVIDCGSWIAGPAATTIMADFGANVIKIEPPGAGDAYRYLPHIPGNPICSREYGWLLDSRSKRGVAIDLTKPPGQGVLHRLVETADVFVTNYPAGVQIRLGVGYDTLAPLNDRLVYASFSGYGEYGEEAGKPGFDVTAWWARSGLMDLVRTAATDPPARPVVGMGNHPSAVTMYAAIVSALYQRERTGKGAKGASSLLASGLWCNGYMAQAAFCDARFLPRPRREESLNALNNYYRCADAKWLILAVLNEDRDWPVLARCLGREDLLTDPRFATRADRTAHSTELIAVFDEVFATQERASWQDILHANRITFDIVAAPQDLPFDQQILDAGLAVPFQDDDTIRTIDSPFTITGVEKSPPRLPPTIGQHTNEVLREVGYTPSEIDELRANGAVA